MPSPSSESRHSRRCGKGLNDSCPRRCPLLHTDRGQLRETETATTSQLRLQSESSRGLGAPAWGARQPQDTSLTVEVLCPSTGPNGEAPPRGAATRLVERWSRMPILAVDL